MNLRTPCARACGLVSDGAAGDLWLIDETSTLSSAFFVFGIYIAHRDAPRQGD